METQSITVSVLLIFLMTYKTCAQSCYLTSFPNGVCENLKPSPNETLNFNTNRNFIYDLKFINCEVPQLSFTLLSNLTKLRRIDLRNSNVSRIEEGAFRDLKNLRMLNLANNLLEDLRNGTFGGLITLEGLRLERNNLRDMDEGAFRDLTKLETLDLSENRLSAAVVNGSMNLINLLLPHNVLTEVSFSGLKRLRTLFLNNNDLQLLPSDVFEDLISLEIVSLAFNNILELPFDIFNATRKLTNIDLSHNSVESIDIDLFDGLFQLQELRLDHNSLTYLKAGSLNNCTSLMVLHLGHNSLEYIEERLFDGLVKLETLTLNHNKLSIVSEKLFQGLSGLKDLQLNDNLISRINIRTLLKGALNLSDITLDNNNWNCHDLLRITEDLEFSRVSFDGGNRFDVPNIEGIVCSDRKVTNKKDEHSRLLKNYLENEFRNSNYYKYFSVDYKNSSFYKFFNDTHLKSNFFQDYLEGSNFFTFFNSGFFNSSFFKFLNGSFKDNLAKRLNILDVIINSTRFDNSKTESLDMGDLYYSRRSFERFVVTFVSIEMIVFGIIIVFMIFICCTACK